MDLKNISRRDFAQNLIIYSNIFQLKEIIHLSIKGEYELITQKNKIIEIKNIKNTEIRLQMKNPEKCSKELNLLLDISIKNEKKDIFLIKMN